MAVALLESEETSRRRREQLWFPGAWVDPSGTPEPRQRPYRTRRTVPPHMQAVLPLSRVEAAPDPDHDGPPIPILEPAKRRRRATAPAQASGPRKCSDLPRPKTVRSRRLTRHEQENAKLLDFVYRGWDRDRPEVRGDCLPGGKNEQRPCPWVSCSQHLGIEVDEENGSIKSVFPSPGDPLVPNFEVMKFTCAMDVADWMNEQGLKELPLEILGRLTNRSIERIRQISDAGKQEMLVKIRRLSK